MRAPSLFEAERLTLEEALEITAQSLTTYFEGHPHVRVAYSGGKDSTATLTAMVHLIETGRVPRPASFGVIYADTRLELPPLQAAALGMLDAVRARGWQTRSVLPEMDHRFFVMMLGRGVPPSHSGFRWCTGMLKVEPMADAMREERAALGSKLLLVTGLRIGESKARDQRIALSCGTHNGECGQGWYQETTPAEVADVLAPILHWRVCHVGDWLMFNAPEDGFPTLPVVDAYGAGIGDTEPLEARTGCLVCPVASRDVVLERLARMPQWSYLAPLLRLRPLYEELAKPRHRLQKDGERRADGTLSKRPMRLGPLAFEARLYALAKVLEIQEEVQAGAAATGRPSLTLINDAELRRIHELIEAETWPQGWDGTEARGDVLLPQVIAEGVVQALLFDVEGA